MEEPRLNIEELYESKKKSDLSRLSIYSKLLERVHQTIRIASRQRNSLQFCSFVMPEVLLGQPNYDFSECLSFVLDRLTVDGFNTRYIHPNLIFISWGHWVPDYVREELKEKKNIEVDHFGQVETPEPTRVEFRTEAKPKTKMQSYKPTGRFVKS
jgi:hypothetical protein|uniref:Uncharacterized protein n=1 Tax=viral metagenome TaxID=1070528 RepID=A0A6C0HMP3_9ZZZZ